MQNDEHWQENMDHICSLYQLLEPKDLFLNTYSKFMKYRLLEENSIGEVYEGHFIDLLK